MVMKCLISLWYWYNPHAPPLQSFQRLKLPWMFVFSPSSDQDKYCQSGFHWLLLGSYSVAEKKNGLLSQRGRGNRAVCEAIRAVQLTDAVDIRLHFLSKRMPFISSTWATWLVEMAFFVQMSGGDISRHPAKMECLESVSAISQMLTAEDMLSPKREHPSSETFLEIGSTLCQMEQDYDALSTLTASGPELVITECQICSHADIYLSEKLSAYSDQHKEFIIPSLAAKKIYHSEQAFIKSSFRMNRVHRDKISRVEVDRFDVNIQPILNAR